MTTSSPTSINPMKALSIPSFAPVVMVTSVFGLISLPKNGEYASAIAFFNLGRPCRIPQPNRIPHHRDSPNTPSWGNIDCTPPYRAPPSLHQSRILGDCSRCKFSDVPRPFHSMLFRAAYSLETLAHVYDWLNRGCIRCLVNDRPRIILSITSRNCSKTICMYQTSCFCPATRFAGVNGSCLTIVVQKLRLNPMLETLFWTRAVGLLKSHPRISKIFD